MSAAQRYASAAYRDGLTESTIKDLASLACWGKHQHNAERDLHRWMPFAFSSGLVTHSTTIEIFDPDSAKIREMEIPILLASDLLHSVWSKQSSRLWDICIGATQTTCRHFWEYAMNDWAENHPVIQHFGFDLICFFLNPEV